MQPVYAPIPEEQIMSGPPEPVDAGMAPSGISSNCDSCSDCDPCSSCGSCSPCACGPSVGRDFFNCGCRTGGIVGGFEEIFLKPFFADRSNQPLPAPGNGGDIIAAPIIGQPASFTYTGAPRAWVGYVNCDGLGIRGRVFDYYGSGAMAGLAPAVLAGGTIAEQDSLALRTFDLEATQQVTFRRWDFTTFGGVRYGQAIGQSNFTAVVPAAAGVFIPGTFTSQNTNTFYGVGLTGGLQADRALTANGRWSFFATGRGSILFGNAHRSRVAAVDGVAVAPTSVAVSDTYLNIWEISAGPQWNFTTRRGSRVFVRTGVEAQVWQNFGALNTADTLGNFSLAGFTAGVGVTR